MKKKELSLKHKRKMFITVSQLSFFMFSIKFYLLVKELKNLQVFPSDSMNGEGRGMGRREGRGGRGSARAYSTDYVISMRSA